MVSAKRHTRIGARQMLKISDYFLAPIGTSRTYTLGGNPIMTLSTLIDGMENYLPKYKLRQLNGKGEWQCDWLLQGKPRSAAYRVRRPIPAKGNRLAT